MLQASHDSTWRPSQLETHATDVMWLYISLGDPLIQLAYR